MTTLNTRSSMLIGRTESPTSRPAVKPFGYKNRYVTPAEAVETTMLVFDLPKDVNEPYLKVRGEFLMGDLFDANQYQRTRVRLF